MKKLLHILLICSFYMILSGRSCEDDSARIRWQEEQAVLARDSIFTAFEMDEPDPEALRAAEVKAMQNLKDLSDFTEIFSNQSMDSTFRDKAAEMMRKMFVSGESKLSYGPVKNEKLNGSTLDELIRKGFGEEIMRVKLEFDSMQIRRPLIKKENRDYFGTISANQQLTCYRKNDSLVFSQSPVLIDFIYVKENKIIEPDTIMVWDVRFF